MQRYGTLYLNMRVDNSAIYASSLFFLRRLLFAMSVSFLSSASFGQVMTLIWVCFGMILFTVHYRHVQEKVLFSFELLNETGLLIVAYLLIPCSMGYFNEDNV